jgi:KDO2-lipid IV(A) lauroyltransferase
MMHRVTLALLWLLHWLPLPLLTLMGNALGLLAWWAAADRRRVTLINLALCFPHWSEAEREAVARRHFQFFATSILSQGVIWFASIERMRSIVRFEGREHLEAAMRKGPVIILAPHFFGFDLAGVCLSAEMDLVSLQSQHKNPKMSRMILGYRMRWNRGLIFSRQEGIRPVLRALKPGWALYYHPDQDFGPRESVFAELFGVKAATTPAMARLARLGKAQVVPCIARQDFLHGICHARFYPAWEDYPTGDDVADARRMNQFLEDRILEQPANYLWSHKRFKTRPAGEHSPYDRRT